MKLYFISERERRGGNPESNFYFHLSIEMFLKTTNMLWRRESVQSSGWKRHLSVFRPAAAIIMIIIVK